MTCSLVSEFIGNLAVLAPANDVADDLQLPVGQPLANAPAHAVTFRGGGALDHPLAAGNPTYSVDESRAFRSAAEQAVHKAEFHR